MPPAESAGEYLHLVVRIQAGGDDCALLVNGPAGPQRIALIPATFVIRLWRSGSAVLRGSISLHGTDVVVPIQSNTSLERLIRAWLFESRPLPPDGTHPN